MTAKRNLSLLFLAAGLIAAGTAFAESINISKTFDGDRIADYTISFDVDDNRNRIVLYYTYEKINNRAMIKYSPPHQWHESFSQLSPILFKLVQKAADMNKGIIDSFMSFEFLGCNDIAKKAVLAFHNDPVWKEYLVESKKKYSRPPYESIKKIMVENGVFSDLDKIFQQLGYSVEFSSFEKLAVRKADQFNFYNDLIPFGIQPEDKFPVPLMLHFDVSAR